MNLCKLILFIFCTACLHQPQMAGANEAPSAAELFKRVEGRFARLQSISYSVKRFSTSKQQAAGDRWLFSFKSPDKVRVDYLEPYSRLIVTDGASLLEYLPSARKALKTDLVSASPQKRAMVLNGALGRVSVDGLRLGNYQEMLRRAVKVTPARVGENKAWLVEGANPRYLVFIDQEKEVPLKTEIYGADGGLILRTEASSLYQAAPGFWLPREIASTTRAADGFYKTTLSLSDIRVDEAIADQVFRFDLPAGVEIATSKQEETK
uniref:Putative outer membrane lipoprotein-sorting protein n=1 Tax=Geobacter sp. (strain M21) TaxID=443144 RepID=C6E6V2_GEOSM